MTGQAYPLQIIFVFGSNFAGHHIAGAAKFAVQHHGAVWGEGIGRVGNSYAIPTMIPLDQIKPHIDVFVEYARHHPGLEFHLTRIGTGIAGYDWDRDIRPQFPSISHQTSKFFNPFERHHYGTSKEGG